LKRVAGNHGDIFARVSPERPGWQGVGGEARRVERGFWPALF
jgi:hypothetical protein